MEPTGTEEGWVPLWRVEKLTGAIKSEKDAQIWASRIAHLTASLMAPEDYRKLQQHVKNGGEFEIVFIFT